MLKGLRIELKPGLFFKSLVQEITDLSSDFTLLMAFILSGSNDSDVFKLRLDKLIQVFFFHIVLLKGPEQSQFIDFLTLVHIIEDLTQKRCLRLAENGIFDRFGRGSSVHDGSISKQIE